MLLCRWAQAKLSRNPMFVSFWFDFARVCIWQNCLAATCLRSSRWLQSFFSSFHFAIVQRDIASCLKTYGAINRFLQPIGNIKQCSPRHTSTAASSKHVRCKLKPSSMDFIHIHFLYLNCYGLAALAIGSTSITTWDAVFWSTPQDTCYAGFAALAFCAVWSTLGADARLASSSAFCAVWSTLGADARLASSSAFCAVWSTLGADARLASSSAFCAVCAIFACSITF